MEDAMSKSEETRSIRSMLATILSLAVMVSMAAMLAGQAHAAKNFRFTMQNMFSLNHPISVAINQMAADLKKESGGRINIQVLPSGALVKGPSIFESVGMGSIDMGTTCSCYHGGILPVAATSFALPGDPRGVQEIINFIQKDEVMDFLRKAYATQGVFFGAPLVMDGYTIVSKKPIEKWEDLKKMKVRASGTIAKTLKEMGIPTVFIPFSEIYVALSRGTIDAEISGNHAESFLAKTYEVAKYQTTPEISGAQNCEVIMNQERWDELPDDLKSMFKTAFKNCSAQVAQLFADENKEVIGKMEGQGARFISLPKDVMNRWTQTAVELWAEELAKDELSAQYIELVKNDLKSLGYDL
jgi:TRAP-type C4-dicarboxylate transport system substrate-binding protein